MMSAMRKRNVAHGFGSLLLLAASAGCGSKSSSASLEPCDAQCEDNIALRAVRETMRFVYNQKLQGKPMGAQDAGADCLMEGTAQVFGNATSNASQGATEVDLTYVFSGCLFTVPKNATRERNYLMTLTGTVTEKGTLAVQPSSTTSLVLSSSALDLKGTVSDPPVAYEQSGCALDAAQNGNGVAGTLCTRPASFSGF
jgi:hypothetical protein